MRASMSEPSPDALLSSSPVTPSRVDAPLLVISLFGGVDRTLAAQPAPEPATTTAIRNDVYRAKIIGFRIQLQ